MGGHIRIVAALALASIISSTTATPLKNNFFATLLRRQDGGDGCLADDQCSCGDLGALCNLDMSWVLDPAVADQVVVDSPTTTSAPAEEPSSSPPTSEGNPPLTSEAPQPTSEAPPENTGDPARCDACSTNMGASECSADDDQCLVDQCSADEDCKACGIDCNTFVQDPVVTGTPEPAPEPSPEPEPTSEAPAEPTCPPFDENDWPSCDVCPGFEASIDNCIAGPTFATCSCPDPCSHISCTY